MVGGIGEGDDPKGLAGRTRPEEGPNFLAAEEAGQQHVKSHPFQQPNAHRLSVAGSDLKRDQLDEDGRQGSPDHQGYKEDVQQYLNAAHDM